MAVLGRVLFSSAERVDLPDLLSIDSYAAGDWKYFLQSFIGTTKPYILTGFDVIDPQNAIGLASCSIRVADSVVYYPGSSAGPFYYGLPEGNANSAPLVPQLRTNATNYIYLTFSTVNSASDVRALWDPDRNGGAGAEFTQDINTESVLQVQVNVSTGSFPVNTIPVAIVVMGPSAISSIQDARDMLFRLGTGGLNPDPANAFNFPSLPSSTYARAEPPTTVSNISDPNSFQGGDKNIQNMKQWMDAVMTRLKELGGSAYWYQDVAAFTMATLFKDALTTTYKSKGQYTHSSATPGQLIWTEDVLVLDAASPKFLTIRANGGSPLVLANDQVAYLDLARNQPVNTLDQPVAFTNGQAYINTIGGSVGLFANLKKGDWVKKVHDADVLFLQVREFYNTTNGGGSVTTAANARSITLSGAYQGITSQPSGDIARYDRGEYQPADVQIANRTSSAITNAGGNFLWFALRNDTVMAISSVATTTVSGTVTTADGASVTVSATAHGMVDGDRVTVTAPVGQVGTFSVDIIDANTFSFKNTNTSTGAFTGYYALCTTTSTSVNGFQTESVNHGFESGETVQVAGTTNFNGGVAVNVRSPTQFQFAITGSHATETAGTATLARLDVRSEEGITKIVQGETIDVGTGTADNIMNYIGMASIAETAPVYTLPSSYSALNGQASYNASASDDLTTRVSKLTAMMADKAQDKSLQFYSTATEAINTASGGNRVVTFAPGTPTLAITQTSTGYAATVTLSAITLATNQSAYITINRNANTTPGVVVVNTSAVPLDENVFVVASRSADTNVRLWNGQTVSNTSPLIISDPAIIQVTYCDPVSSTLATGTGITVDGLTINAGETVLATNLGTGNNEIYLAQGAGTTISGWAAQSSFHGAVAPANGDKVLVLKGNGFADQVGTFNGTSWGFNDKVRYFNGANYWEQSNIISAALSDNTTGTVFTVAWSGNEHMVVDYSIVRSTSRETGTMRIVTDGTAVDVSTESAYINGNTGVTFTGSISASNLVLSYTATSTGQAATMKYMTRRWSSGTGGPGGLPSYSGAAAAPTAAAAPVGSVQFNSGGSLAGNANFQIDTVDLSYNSNGLRQGVLSSGITILNNQASFTNLFAMPNTYPYVIVKYSITKEGFARTGQMLVAYDGTNVISNDTHVETGVTGVALQAVVSGGNIQFQYTSTAGAGNGTFKYSWTKWS
jgi:hypothetical protein